MEHLGILVNKSCTDAIFNLAAEEYQLCYDTSDSDCFMLWRNAPSVIIGKNQNVYNEINFDFVKQNDIKVVRRQTGGGAVFHDLGNINYTCIMKTDRADALDFKSFTLPVVEALRALGANAALEGRNDICIDGKKVSGNAQCVKNNRIMHHGTLLFSSELSDLAGSLNVSREKIEDKGIKSVRARVTNISSHINCRYDVTGFMDYLAHFVADYYKTSHIINLEAFDPRKNKTIADLVKDKYSTWEWNFGSSPKFTFRNRKKFPYGTVEVCASVNGGIIDQVKIFGDFFGAADVDGIEKALTGAEFTKSAVEIRLSKINLRSMIMGSSETDIAGLFENI